MNKTVKWRFKSQQEFRGRNRAWSEKHTVSSLGVDDLWRRKWKDVFCGPSIPQWGKIYNAGLVFFSTSYLYYWPLWHHFFQVWNFWLEMKHFNTKFDFMLVKQGGPQGCSFSRDNVKYLSLKPKQDASILMTFLNNCKRHNHLCMANVDLYFYSSCCIYHDSHKGHYSRGH